MVYISALQPGAIFAPSPLPQDICQHLETYLVVTTRHRYLVDRGQVYCSPSCDEQDSPHNSCPAKNVNSAEDEKPELDDF